jgi:A/G-specific adenine glycosylase
MELGATICTPRNPACGICPWRAPCRGRIAGTAPDLPLKLPKKPKPVRVGYAYVGRRADGAWLVERRPDSGLLGGMLGWPGSDWAEVPPDPAPPLRADWRMLAEEARHTFTHFHLRLKVLIADLPVDATTDRGHFVPHHEFRPADLPTAMRKVFDLAHRAVATDGTGLAEDRQDD